MEFEGRVGDDGADGIFDLAAEGGGLGLGGESGQAENEDQEEARGHPRR